MIDFHKTAIVPLIPLNWKDQPFEVLVYGYNAVELFTIPNEVVSSLARRYPGYTSSPFILRDWSR